MNNQTENNSFSYTYSAKQQAEIENIRKKYAPSESNEDKMEQLRRLYRSVSQKATTVSLILGILGTLIMGIGMCCTMVWQNTLFIPGIIIGIIGITILSIAYPIYKKVLIKDKEKIAPEILRLTDELLQ